MKFLFDLDSTITQEEILPKISQMVGKEEEMKDLTERTMLGEFPFEESFSARVNLLRDIPVSQVSKMIQDIRLNDKLVDFMRENRESCYIVTGNLDAWIEGLIHKLGMDGHCFCSKATIQNDKIVKIAQIISKENTLSNFSKDCTIAVGDGSNDRDLLKNANVGIAFGGVRPIAPVLFDVCDYAVYTEEKLCSLLNSIVAGGGYLYDNK